MSDHLQAGRRVVKLGGSLLDSGALVPGLRTWLASQHEVASLIVCGGGRLVDALRHWDQCQPIDSGASHWSAIRLMDETTRLVASLFPEYPLVSCDLEPGPRGHCFVECYRFLREHSRLPHDWTVTSDSIAAELAWQLGLDEVCLLKSTLPVDRQIAHWCKSGFVDPEFEAACRRLQRVTVVDLLSGRSLSTGNF